MRALKISNSITNRKRDSLEKYLNELGKFELLKIDEEIQLAMRIAEGDEAALERLVNANLRFVISVSKKYQDKGVRLSDLISEGNIGLIKAAKRYDHTKGFKFISFAVWWIRQAILSAISDQQRMVRLPGNQLVGNATINKAAMRLEQKLERMPTIEEIAAEIGFKEGRVLEHQESALPSISLDKPINEESGFCLLDKIASSTVKPSDDELMKESLAEDIKRCLVILPEREQKILSLYYGLHDCTETTLDDMVFIFDLSKERLRQLKDKALKTLRNSPKSELIREYLD
ncbi:sigma-70 family RNA polymerase sigma factor [Pedobacter gandavensis]|uniref:Sigma-70 family RNA polymerase sigma factor n=1 Tax=Pedobacter gandavensis TaxID=2679963 RepID=A0ABR6EUB0_9SPHI|nr:RNA polymerase sigma factor RpoD/SigA [Pedobacter gandavensis]MBB2148853.1 sigma-70 family RNA polymerase sigma factor [Pedobacter gandavensis]